MENKKCSTCKEHKPLSDFNKNKTKKDGYHDVCKICVKEYKKIYYQKNKEIIEQKAKIKLLENKEIKNKYWKNYRKENPKKIKKYRDNWKSKNKEKINEYERIRRNTNYVYKLISNLRSSISSSIRRNGFSKKSKTVDILGCSFQDFIKHLESKFEDWMTWDNYGLYNGQLNYGWDVDHIIPTNSAKTEDDVIKLNHYTNLQPLCSKTNRDVKNGKYI